eukprot:CAMPEP_0172320548 /NCGR_PEP_ID=MMETSP1058-20130122/40770_1 /TAXON_ID=83371 /ORGANISM="Detonula confervacea, Strain CCMP 353" /LENGTH=267 /DNA_ID=CAMNT_0013035835 /DNA_START=150 /DNA_END=953 /DNA_ORIENTATION=-
MSQPSSGIASASANAIAIPLTAPQKCKRGPRGGIYDPFPLKFHRMLDRVREEELESVVSWISHGRAFKIHKPKVFAATIMPRFFNQSKYTSFQRQLNLYGFSRCCRGRDAGAYHHPCFLRGKQPLAKNIVRTKIKGNGHKTMKLHEGEPDFHAMVPLTDDNQESDGSSISSASSLEQPTVTASSVGCGLHASSPPPLSILSNNFLNTNTVSPSSITTTELSRGTSLSEKVGNSSSFANDLNQSIFIHELALGCTILCQLKATVITNL